MQLLYLKKKRKEEVLDLSFPSAHYYCGLLFLTNDYSNHF